MAPITVYDAVNVEAIPSTASTLLAYIDGGYVTYPACRARFPHATILTITVTGRNRANIIDVEGGDATSAMAAAWVRAGLGDTVYSSLSTKPALDNVMGRLAWNWYAADPTGWPHTVVGSVATQWAWPGIGSPGAYDVSWADPAWLSPSAPVPTSLPTTPIEEILTMVATDPAFAVRYLYRFALHREVDPQSFTNDVNYLNGGGTLNQLLANLQDSPEGQAVIVAERKAMGLTP